MSTIPCLRLADPASAFAVGARIAPAAPRQASRPEDVAQAREMASKLPAQPLHAASRPPRRPLPPLPRASAPERVSPLVADARRRGWVS